MTQVALIRGINLGPNKRVSMAALKAACERMGFTNVRTLLNSGNVVFSTRLSPKSAAAKIERALEQELKVPASVLVLTAEDLRAAAEANRFASAAANHSRLFVGFLWELVKELDALRQRDWGKEQIALGPGVAYLWCPESFETPLVKAFHKVVGTGVTVRNWATVQKLLALTQAEAKPVRAPKKSPAKAAARRPVRRAR
jgi:uncharacterized protein (DUF1697 family)